MTSKEILKTKSEFNKWLLQLTDLERELIIEMMNEAMEVGYDKGFIDCNALAYNSFDKL